MKCWQVMIFSRKHKSRFWAKQPDSTFRPPSNKTISLPPSDETGNPAMLKMFYGYKLEETENPFYSHLLRWNNSNHIKKHFSEQYKIRT